MIAKFKPNQKVKYIRTVDVDEGFFTPGKIYETSRVKLWNDRHEGIIYWLEFDSDDTGHPNGHSGRFFEPVRTWTIEYANEKVKLLKGTDNDR